MHCAADFCFMNARAIRDVFGGHAFINSQMEQDPPFTAQHAVAVFVNPLKSEAALLCSLIEQIGYELSDIKVKI